MKIAAIKPRPGWATTFLPVALALTTGSPLSGDDVVYDDAQSREVSVQVAPDPLGEVADVASREISIQIATLPLDQVVDVASREVSVQIASLPIDEVVDVVSREVSVHVAPLEVTDAISREVSVQVAAVELDEVLDTSSREITVFVCGEECALDCNDNGIADLLEILDGISPDCNTNGIPDSCDLDDGASVDCTGNGIPDECETDCNGNAVADSCDIQDGTSLDCNANTIPDECDIADCPGGLDCGDCNANGVPDECDIADDTSEDCTANGIPDECEPDCNDNGRADSCDIAFCAEGDSACDDCNNNGTPDSCDILTGSSQDADADGVPDECSFWISDSGSWSNANNWDPPIVPNNDSKGEELFNVVIYGETSVVTLDIDAVIDTLVLESGASLDITEGDLAIATPGGIYIDGACTVGADHAVTALGPFTLDGTQPLRLDDASALLTSDSSGDTITNRGSIRGAGMVDADLHNMGTLAADEPGETLTLTGPLTKVNDGTLSAENDGLLLITETQVTGLGELVASGGTVQLMPGLAGASFTGQTLDARLDGRIELFDDFTTTLTGNATIADGAVYRAATPGGSSAILTAQDIVVNGSDGVIGGQIVLDGSMGADALGEIIVGGDGGFCFGGPRGCTPPVLNVVNDASAESSEMQVDGGQVLLGERAYLFVIGMMTLGPNGLVQADPDRVEPCLATIDVGLLDVLSETTGAGELSLEDEMMLNVAGNMSVNGAIGCGVSGPRGCTPPVLKMTDSAGASIGGDMLIDAAEVRFDSTTPLLLTGDFDNHSTLADLFDWDSGAITLQGSSIAPRTFEAAGEDRGPYPVGYDTNFAVGTLELDVGVNVDLVDNHDNQQDGAEGCEALYVGSLIVREGAVLNTSGCRIYYGTLDNHGTITGLGVDVIELKPCDGDVNGNGQVDPLDSGFVLSRFDCPVGTGNPDCDAADVNANGAVDPLDVGYVLSRFGTCE